MKYKILTLALVVLLGACSDKLDLKPTDTIETSRAYQSFDDLEAGLAGAYSSASGTSAISTSSYQTDMTKMATGGRNIGVTQYNWNYNALGTGVEFTFGWATNYIAINGINLLLAGVESIVPSEEEMERHKQIKGEAIALRAYLHFELFRNYAESYTDGGKLVAPYMTESVISSPERLTVSAFVSQLEADIEEAKSLLAGYDPATPIYVSTSFLQALELKLALYQEDYTKVIAIADTLLGMYDIADIMEIGEVFDRAINSEAGVIFKFAIPDNGGRIGAIWQDSNGTVNFEVTQDFINKFSTDYVDVRQDINISEYDGLNVVGKYLGTDAAVGASDFFVFRAEEILLSRAEAYYYSGDEAKALADLNTLRTARLESYVAGSESGANLLQAIKTERAIELAFEGHRWFDIRRWGDDIIRVDVTAATTPKLLSGGDYRFVMPIPNHELLANTSMVQNPGYQTN
ncbi:RagB/SusD family nutrient uptake outer membrane protein [Persicobacter sp. CCB-QB2]|uniref:RagB/SusD family nutrient uptake outer membrane protein n=1 Tax=Persicobacter sp. CCB-QB2 TaxID=1561025 RepID=UPI0006A97ED5|nr:RagB/SusD family nutrient uptake outer membrane protein [Persicobacter sp. CCB-QB2]